MKRQQISVIDFLTFVLIVPFIVLVFSSTGWLLLTLVSPASQPAKPALVRIRHTLPPLRPVTAAPAMAAVDPVHIQPEPTAVPVEATQPEPEAAVNPVEVIETEAVVDMPMEQPPATVSQPEPIAPKVEPTSMAEATPQPVIVAESEPTPEAAPIIYITADTPAETEAAAPVPTATPLPPLFDPSSPPDVSFFDQLLEQVRQ